MAKKEEAMVELEIETLARRLERVERENRWLKGAGVVALAVMPNKRGTTRAHVIQKLQETWCHASTARGPPPPPPRPARPPSYVI